MRRTEKQIKFLNSGRTDSERFTFFPRKGKPGKVFTPEECAALLVKMQSEVKK